MLATTAGGGTTMKASMTDLVRIVVIIKMQTTAAAGVVRQRGGIFSLFRSPILAGATPVGDKEVIRDRSHVHTLWHLNWKARNKNTPCAADWGARESGTEMIVFKVLLYSVLLLTERTPGARWGVGYIVYKFGKIPICELCHCQLPTAWQAQQHFETPYQRGSSSCTAK